MTFEAALYSYLAGYTALYALIGTRINPNVRIQDPSLPAESIVYEIDQDRRYQQFAANPTATLISLRVTAYGLTSASCKAVAAQVYAALQGYTLGTDGRLLGGLTFTADATTNALTSAAHGFSDTNRVRVANSGGALPGGLAANTDYYARDVTSDTLKLAATSGGAAIDLTTAGTGTNTIGNVVILSAQHEDSVDDFDDNAGIKGSFLVTQDFGIIYRL